MLEFAIYHPFAIRLPTIYFYPFKVALKRKIMCFFSNIF